MNSSVMLDLLLGDTESEKRQFRLIGAHNVDSSRKHRRILFDRLKRQSPTGIVLNSMVTYKKIVFGFCHKVNSKVIALLLS